MKARRWRFGAGPKGRPVPAWGIGPGSRAVELPRAERPSQARGGRIPEVGLRPRSNRRRGPQRRWSLQAGRKRNLMGWSSKACRLPRRQIINGLVVPPFQGLENNLGTLTRGGAHFVRLPRAIAFRAFSPFSLGLVDSAATGFAALQRFRPAGAEPCVATRPTDERCNDYAPAEGQYAEGHHGGPPQESEPDRPGQGKCGMRSAECRRRMLALRRSNCARTAQRPVPATELFSLGLSALQSTPKAPSHKRLSRWQGEFWKYFLILPYVYGIYLPAMQIVNADSRNS